MTERKSPPPQSAFDDGYAPSPAHIDKLADELSPKTKVLDEERRRGEAIILSCMSPAELAILAGDDSIFFTVPPPELGSARPPKT
jgi:hypothetical protein